MYGAIPIGGKALLQTNRIQQTGHDGSTHSYSEGEVEAFVNFINANLWTDTELQGHLPLDPNNHQQFFDALSDGVLLCKLLNIVAKDSINMKNVVNKSDMTIYHKTQNLNIALNAMNELGIKIVNIGAEDILKGKRHLVLSLVWQVIKYHLLNNINLVSHPEIVQLLSQGEDTTSFTTLEPERLILRWFNYNLQKAGHNSAVNNFNEDLKDGQKYLVLMSEIAPHIVPKQVLMEQDPQHRAEFVCDFSKQMGIYQFLTPKNIIEGNNNLNLAFTADMFNKYPSIKVDNLNEIQYKVLAEAKEKIKMQYEEMERARAARWALEEDQRKTQWDQEELERLRIRENWEKEDEERRRKFEEDQRLLSIQQSQQVTLGDNDPRSMALPEPSVYPPVPPVMTSNPPTTSVIPPSVTATPYPTQTPIPPPPFASVMDTNYPSNLPPGGCYPPTGGTSPYDPTVQIPPYGPGGGYPGPNMQIPPPYGPGGGYPDPNMQIPPPCGPGGGYPGPNMQIPPPYGPGGGYPRQDMYQQQTGYYQQQQIPVTVYQTTTTVYRPYGYPPPMATGIPYMGAPIDRFKKHSRFKKFKY